MTTTVQARQSKFSLRTITRYVLLLLFALVAAGPMFWLLTLAFKTQSEYVAEPFGLPETLVWENFRGIIENDRMITYAFNSVVITLAAVALVLFCSTLAGFALARIQFRGSRILFVAYIMSNAVPIFVVLLPLFILIQFLGLSGSRWSLIFPYAALNMGISVFIMRGFFRSLPSEMEDAARIDGCNTLQMLWYVMLPLIRPGAVVVVIYNFINFWNEYYLAALLLPSQELFTLPPGLAASFIQQYAVDWPGMASGIIISAIPIVLIFVFAQEKIVEGWTMSHK